MTWQPQSLVFFVPWRLNPFRVFCVFRGPPSLHQPALIHINKNKKNSRHELDLPNRPTPCPSTLILPNSTSFTIPAGGREAGMVPRSELGKGGIRGVERAVQFSLFPPCYALCRLFRGGEGMLLSRIRKSLRRIAKGRAAR